MGVYWSKNNMEQERSKAAVNKFVTESSYVLLFVTFIAFSCCYYIEFGYCKFFDIPIEFISIDLKNYVPCLIVFILLFLPIGMSIREHFFLITKLQSFVKKKSWLGNLFLIITLAMLVIGSILRMSIFSIYTLLVMIIGTLALFCYLESDEHLLERPIIKTNTVRTFFILILITAIFSVCGYYIGLSKAASQHEFFVKPDNKTILINKYGDIKIFAELVNKKAINIYVTNSYPDTLHKIIIP